MVLAQETATPLVVVPGTSNEGNGWDNFGEMECNQGGLMIYNNDAKDTTHWDGDAMELSCRTYTLTPAYSVYAAMPRMEGKPEWELDILMTEETSPDTPFDLERWTIQTYFANMEYAAKCKFEHPGAHGQNNSNPFAPLQSNTNSGKARGNTAGDYYLTSDGIQTDLGNDRPQWVLSAYGPGKEAPEQLWGGTLEQSPEEMRLHAMMGEAAGNLPGAVSSYICGCILYNYMKLTHALPVERLRDAQGRGDEQD